MGRTRSRSSVGKSIIHDLTHTIKPWQLSAMDQKRKLYLVEINPETADRIVEHCNLRNRKVRQSKVMEFAGYMAAGKWQLREMILMSDSGELLDGQHRILAVSESHVSTSFILMVIPATQAVDVNRFTDIGTPRNLADFLHFNHVPDSHRIAPILVYERNVRIATSPLQSAKGTKDDYLMIFRDIGDEKFKTVFDIMPLGLHSKLAVNRAFLDWFGLHVTAIDPSSAELFFGLLHDPSQLKKTDAAYVLHDALVDLQRRHQKVSLVQQAHMTAKGWRSFSESTPTTKRKLSHKPNEDWPGIFGEAGL